ncbi:MAG: hypothetical protein AB7I19_07455 [Planctomycetota bacterium]
MSNSRIASGLLVALALAVACAHWPLAIYGVTLAIFGLPHALVELQWVGRRYGAWQHLMLPVTALLGVVAGSRAASLQLGYSFATTATIELALGALLIVAVLPAEWRRCALRTTIALVALGTIGVGIAAAPIDALLVLAIAHNLTPAGFLADRLRDSDTTRAARRAFATLATTCFLILPAWLASGIAAEWLGLSKTIASVGDGAVGTTLGIEVADGISAFRPSFVAPDRALDLLRACAFLQVVHYVSVLYVMPKLAPLPQIADSIRTATPNGRTMLALLVITTLLFAIAFLHDFREARAAYGVFAAVHVWIEFPALLLALTPRALVPTVK